jgi:hypothetical protein
MEGHVGRRSDHEHSCPIRQLTALDAETRVADCLDEEWLQYVEKSMTWPISPFMRAVVKRALEM